MSTAKEKPVLNEESFQRLLAAAFMLQSENDSKPIATGQSRAFATTGIIQKRTPSIRRSASLPTKLKPPVQFTHPRLWRTIEPLAVTAVFCMMIGVSVRRVSPLPVGPSRPVMAGVQTASSNSQPEAKVSGLSRERLATSNFRPSTRDHEAEVIAKDTIIRYQRPPAAVPDHRAPQKIKGSLRSEDSALKPGVRYTFGDDNAMLAADTVVRYPTGSAALPVEGQKKP